MFSFSEIEPPLRKLLEDFGPVRKTYHPELPFWHLTSDGIWDLENVDVSRVGVGSASVKRRLLLEQNALGGLNENLYKEALNPKKAAAAIRSILEGNFPESIHGDLLSAVGMDPSTISTDRNRDPRFREIVLQAYQNECAICGYSSRLGNILVGVEAAHIKWHQAGGPDEQPNGVALCSLHHKLFDRGIITISEQYKILVSELATGSAIFIHLVTDFHGQELRMPIRIAYNPQEKYLLWHMKEVFRQPFRELRRSNIMGSTMPTLTSRS